MRLISHLEIKIQLVPGKISIKDWSFNFIEKLIFGITAMALWVNTFQSNRKVPGSNFTRHLAGLGDTTSLRGKQWPLGWNSTVARDWPWDWPWGSQAIDKKNSVFTIHDNTSSDVKSFIIRGFTKKKQTLLTYCPSYNLTPPISRVLIGQHLIFCSLTSPTSCNSPRKCTPVKYKKRQKAGFPIVT